MSIVCIESESTMKSIGFLIVFFLYLYDVNGECSLGDYRPFPGNCSKFYECINGQKVEQICLAGFHWSKDLETCDWPEIANCGTEPVNSCLTQGCIHAATSVIERMDQTVEPCDDFYKFACGKFMKETQIPADKTLVDMFSIVEDKLVEQLRSLIEENVNLNDPKPFNMAKQLYKECMNTAVIEEHGLEPLLNITDKVGGWPVVKGKQWDVEWKPKWNWQWAVKKLRKIGFSMNYIFRFSIFTDLNNSTSRIIYIDPATTGLSKEYLRKGFEEKVVKAYYKYMVDVAVIFGANRSTAEQELREVVEFEIKLANISLPQEKRRNYTSQYHPYALSDVRKMYPYVQWVKYINALLPAKLSINREEIIMVGTPSYFEKLGKLLEDTDKRVIANYMMWRVASYSVYYMTNELRQLQQVIDHAVSGATARVPRWKECIGVTSESFTEVVGALYVRKFFRQDSKSAALEIVNDIREEIKNILEGVKWMDDGTRTSALEKFQATSTNIGYPDELMDDSKIEKLYENLDIDGKNYFESILRVKRFKTDFKLNQLRKPVNKTDWVDGIMPAVVEAYYHPLKNSIFFPAGILQGQFFSADRPRYLNYGAIGSIIGHELTHGFDDQGSQFDLNGELVDWWQPQTKERYLEKTKCIINQYGNYTDTTTSLNLNGVNTQGENIADNLGIKLSYLAYKKWVQKNFPEKKLPGLQQFTPQQMFWISVAQTWCSVDRPESIKQQILIDAHSPYQFRVKGPLSNLKEFANDFECPKGSPMNPVAKCEIW